VRYNNMKKLETILLPVIEPYCGKDQSGQGGDYEMNYSSSSDYQIKIPKDKIARDALILILNTSQSHQNKDDFLIIFNKEPSEWTFDPKAVQFNTTTELMPLLNISPDISLDEDMDSFDESKVINVGYHVQNSSEMNIVNTCGIQIEFKNGEKQWFLLPLDTHPHYANLINVATGMFSVPDQNSFGKFYIPDGSDYPVLISLSGTLRD
jgi:hypothetical protein